MLNNLKNILIGIFSAIIVVAIGASAYSAFAGADTNNPIPADTTADFGQGNGNGNGNSNGNGGAGVNQGTGTTVLDIPASDLSAEETASLLFMREEEKLARDVYNALYEIWGQPAFQSIAASEQAHMDEIKVLLDRYNLADPALEPGSFSDPSLGALYDLLVAQGSVSLADALKVGATIEEIDILDLQERIALSDNEDIRLVFGNLMAGSENHLKSFTGTLFTQTGETYQPQYLTAEAYAAIISGQTGNGNQGSQGQGQGSQGQGGQGQGGNGYRGGQGNQGASAATIDMAYASTITGTVSAYDTVNLSIFAGDGQTITVLLGSNSAYTTSIGFYPQIGQDVSVYAAPDSQGLLNAITITLDGQIYTFRDTVGLPLWSTNGGRGNGRGGGNH